MATRIETKYISDFSGALLTDEDRVTKKFSIGRKSYVLDMAHDEVDLFEKAVENLTAIATHIPKKRKKVRR